MSSAEAAWPQRETALLALARRSIDYGFRFGLPLPVDAEACPQALRAPGASFVTLRSAGALRGCVGTLEAHRPLAVDVAENAFRSANRDPRFPPLDPEEGERVEIHVSILSPLETIRFRSEAELLAALDPGRHGLLISSGARRATLLPQVWEQLADPREFLRHVMAKAGLPPGTPCAELRAARYTVEELAGPLVEPAAPAWPAP